MRTQLTKIVFAAVIAALLPLTSCDAASNPSALAGKWIGVSGDDEGTVMELLGDGTGIFTKGSKGVAITWKTENGRFYITAFGQAEAEDYKLQGSLLTFTDDKGKVSEYTKCKKDCKEAAAEYVKAKYAKVKKGSFSDSRDGKSYKTVKLDKQTWMAENLNHNAEGSKCYDNEEGYCAIYGRLYDWETAKTVCPSGWHLPSYWEWDALMTAVGGFSTASRYLKATSGWNSNGNGLDSYGFAALPGGDGCSTGGVGYYGVWWGAEYGEHWDIEGDEEDASWNDHDNESCLFSIRCLLRDD